MRYKQFLTGFLVGAVLFSLSPVSAAIEEYLCYKADYKVVINGVEYTDADLPILNYKGNTYAPFKSILEKAGLAVTWNAELNQAEVTASPTSAQINDVEETAMSTTATTIEYDSATKLPTGAEVIEYEGCEDAVRYNGNVYVSFGDLASKFGIKSKQINVQSGTRTFEKNQSFVNVDLNAEDGHFLSSTGESYYNVNLFGSLIGE